MTEVEAGTSDIERTATQTVFYGSV